MLERCTAVKQPTSRIKKIKFEYLKHIYDFEIIILEE